jgi:allophanate hydrolase
VARKLLHSILYTDACTKNVTSLPLTLADWQAALRDGADPGALLPAVRARLAAREGDPAVITLVGEAALAARIEALRRVAAGRPRAELLAALPLYGVPFAVKDNIDVEGVPTTAACPAFAHVAARSAAVVRKLEDAGAVWMAKTNLDQFATGLVGTRSPYGRPASVFDAQRISGGSSSGSAVLVARGDVPFALGTDTAGSGRVPAGFNQLVGLKPTPGRVSTAGVLPACRTLDCVSVFALDVDDAAQVLAVIEGADDDAYSRFAPGPVEWGGAALRIAVPAAPAFTGGDGYAAAWDAALRTAQDAGHVLHTIDMAPLDAVAALLYDGPWVAERHAVVETLLAQDPQAFDPAVRSVIGRAAGMTATDAFRAQYRLAELARRAEALWGDADVLMVPTAPGHPTFAAVDADPVGANAALGAFTNFVNLLGWCALAVPAGTAPGGLPFGVTFIARGGHDAALARFARQWHATAARDQALTLGGTGCAFAAAPLPPLWPRCAPVLHLAVVGAHLSGLPLNGQLRERGATLVCATTTAPAYRLHALPGTVPPKPGLVRVPEGGHAIALEVWAMPQAAVGSFLALIPPPLGLGSIELAGGRWVHGFLCEAHAVAQAPDVSHHGGWRAYLAAQRSA